MCDLQRQGRSVLDFLVSILVFSVADSVTSDADADVAIVSLIIGGSGKLLFISIDEGKPVSQRELTQPAVNAI